MRNYYTYSTRSIGYDTRNRIYDIPRYLRYLRITYKLETNSNTLIKRNLAGIFMLFSFYLSIYVPAEDVLDHNLTFDNGSCNKSL